MSTNNNTTHAWDLLTYNDLQKVLARKTGQDVESFYGRTREDLTTTLLALEPPDNHDNPETAKRITELEDRCNVFDYRLTSQQQYTDAVHDKLLAKIKEIKPATVFQTIVIDRRTEPERTTTLPRQHRDFELLLQLLRNKLNVLMIGPAGSGKTQAAMNVATVLGLPFYSNGAIDTEYKLMGFIDAQGRVVSTAWKKAWCNGGVYLWDELDGSMPPATIPFNTALGNHICDFPDGAVPRHPDFYCIAAGNTFYGADYQFVGRYKQDGAFLDRFQPIDWHYDLDLEYSLAADLWPEEPEKVKMWVDTVVRCREQAALKGLQIIISPRSSIAGVKLLRDGMPWDLVVRSTIKKITKAADWEKIAEYAEIPKPKPPPVVEPVHTPYKGHDPEDPTDYKPDYKPYNYPRETRSPGSFKVKSHGKQHKSFIRDLIP